jgi:hypothetical protein
MCNAHLTFSIDKTIDNVIKLIDMNKYNQTLVITIVFSLLFFGLLFILLLFFKKLSIQRETKLKEMLENNETRGKALLVYKKREKISNKAMEISKYYLIIFSLFCIFLSIYMLSIEMKNNKLYSIENFKYVIVFMLGLYFFFNGIINIIKEYLYKIYLVHNYEEYKILLTNNNNKLFGTVKVINKNKFSIYIFWNIFDEQENNICCRAFYIFLKKVIGTENIVMNKVIEDIKKYGFGKIKYFKEYDIKIIE